MMIEGYISRESDNPGYYRVVPSMGGGAVEAIDIHRVGNFVPGERVTIIQIGSEYGIAKASRMLPSVLEVPKAARDALAEQNPAQFFCAYLGAQLGRFKRIYVLAEILSLSGNEIEARIALGAEAGKVIKALVKGGQDLAASDFSAGDIVALFSGSDNLFYVCGWWSAAEIIKGLRVFILDPGRHDFTIPHRRQNQEMFSYTDILTEENPAGVGNITYEKTERGFYDLTGSLGEVGAFYPFRLTYELTNNAPNAINSFDPDDNDEWIIISQLSGESFPTKIGNDIKFTYQVLDSGRLKTRLTGLQEIKITDSANYSEFGSALFSEVTTLKIKTDGSVRIGFFTASSFSGTFASVRTATLLNNPQNYAKCQIGDFYGQVPFVITMPPGSVDFIGEPVEITRGAGGCIGTIDLKTGAFEITSSEGNWSIYGNRQAGNSKNATIILELDDEIVGSSIAGTIDIEVVDVDYMGDIFPLGAFFYAKKYTPEAA